MKKILALIIFLFGWSCQKEDLKLYNPNAPGLASLNSEAGIKAFALGLMEKPFGWAQDGWLLIALSYHSIMGDEVYIPWSNFDERWIQQYSKIRLPNGEEYQHPANPGISQKTQLQGFNTRSQFSGPFIWEWDAAYYTIGQANRLMEVVNDPSSTVKYSGNAQTKIGTLNAWALWWKGYSYSRLGSMYLSGVIVDKLGTTNGNYKDRTALIAEANRNFDECNKILAGLSDDTDYNEIMMAVIPSFNNNQNIVSPAMWVRMINTYKARNILVNKKTTEMTSSDWNEVMSLGAQGLQAADNIFTLGMTPNGINDLTVDYHPYIRCNDAYGWWYASERLVQDYKPGDARLVKNHYVLNTPYVNIRNRGWTFGTRYAFVDIEAGGSYATAQGKGQWPISPTYEENQLMLAEARIRTGDIDGGLTLVDQVRNFQSAGLASVAGTGLNQVQALDELRRERRVGLALRGLAFYDARRWGVTSPEASGGGRAGAMIIIPANIYDPESDGKPAAYPCFLEYNYMDYWDVPANESDFNIPLAGSSTIKN